MRQRSSPFWPAVRSALRGIAGQCVDQSDVASGRQEHVPVYHTHEGELKTSCIRFRIAVYCRMSNGGDHLISRCAADAADRVGC
jgi:hypothetical protein